jgi:hypothetical protein
MYGKEFGPFVQPGRAGYGTLDGSTILPVLVLKFRNRGSAVREGMSSLWFIKNQRGSVLPLHEEVSTRSCVGSFRFRIDRPGESDGRRRFSVTACGKKKDGKNEYRLWSCRVTCKPCTSSVRPLFHSRLLPCRRMSPERLARLRTRPFVPSGSGNRLDRRLCRQLQENRRPSEPSTRSRPR